MSQGCQRVCSWFLQRVSGGLRIKFVVVEDLHSLESYVINVIQRSSVERDTIRKNQIKRTWLDDANPPFFVFSYV